MSIRSLSLLGTCVASITWRLSLNYNLMFCEIVADEFQPASKIAVCFYIVMVTNKTLLQKWENYSKIWHCHLDVEMIIAIFSGNCAFKVAKFKTHTGHSKMDFEEFRVMLWPSLPHCTSASCQIFHISMLFLDVCWPTNECHLVGDLYWQARHNKYDEFVITDQEEAETVNWKYH